MIDGRLSAAAGSGVWCCRSSVAGRSATVSRIWRCWRHHRLPWWVGSTAVPPRSVVFTWPPGASQGTATGFAGLNGGGHCRRTACGTRWDSWEWNSAVVRFHGGPGYYKRSNVVCIWFRCLRHEKAEGRRLPEVGLPLVKKQQS